MARSRVVMAVSKSLPDAKRHGPYLKADRVLLVGLDVCGIDHTMSERISVHPTYLPLSSPPLGITSKPPCLLKAVTFAPFPLSIPCALQSIVRSGDNVGLKAYSKSVLGFLSCFVFATSGHTPCLATSRQRRSLTPYVFMSTLCSFRK